MSAETVREWQKMYRVIGRGGLLAMGVKQARYDYETKVAAARAVVDGGMSKPEAMVRFGIVSATPLKQWCRLYREGGAQALNSRAILSRYSFFTRWSRRRPEGRLSHRVPAVGIDAHQDTETRHERDQRGAAIAEQRQRQTHHRQQAGHHAGVYKSIEEKN